PKTVKIPSLMKFTPNENLKDVLTLVEKEFSDHSGQLKEFWLPTTRAQAHKFLNEFVTDRLENFGPYEDALTERSDFVFHSGISPMLNVGLLTPDEVVKKVLQIGQELKIPMASLEGFIRQVIGWREFIRGIYQNFSEQQSKLNFFNHKKKLKDCWYEGTTGIPPLDQSIHKVQRLAYNHHIERLMVIGNLMTLLEIEPREAHRWFMEMYVDSSDWVMGPNVYGMALFSDGGIFATKPYICGSNFYRKMGSFPKGDWCDEVDGLYWEFIDKNRSFLSKNPRTMMMVKILDRMDKTRRKDLSLAASKIRRRLTT
ncbi:MAG: FAD-binding domain-containing protein, partial [Bdellovibrionales bacterium]